MLFCGVCLHLSVCGSKPAVLFWWLCLSYPVGLGTLACELWFLEGIFLGLEQQAITSSTPTGTRPFSMWLRALGYGGGVSHIFMGFSLGADGV